MLSGQKQTNKQTNKTKLKTKAKTKIKQNKNKKVLFWKDRIVNFNKYPFGHFILKILKYFTKIYLINFTQIKCSTV